MSKPDPPTPPNPIATAAAQTGSNVSTAVANSFLNNINQSTPQGSLNFDVTGSHQWTDPTTNQKYTIPTFTSTQSYGIDPNTYLQQNPDVAASGMDPQQHWRMYGQKEGRAASGEAALYKTNQQTKQSLAEMGLAQSNRASGLLSTPFDPDLDAQKYLQQNPDVLAAAKAAGVDPMQFAAQHWQQYGQTEGRAGGAPGAGDASTITGVPKALTSFEGGGPIQSSLGNYGQQQGTFGEAGDITRSYGPEDNFSADRQRTEDALMARMNPQLSKERSNIEQRLADQGIRYGSAAYQGAMDDYSRQANDARFAAVGQAGSEQQRMNQMANQLAQFQNTAQGQAYSQAQGRGQFANEAQMQNYQQALGAGSFANAAQNQQFGQNAQQAGFTNAGLAQQLAQAQSGFNAANSQRNQYMQEQYAQRNQPLNEITAMMSGSQVQQPNWLNSPTSQIPTTDIAGIMQNNFANQSSNYQAANQNWQSTMGGLLGLGGKLGGAAIMASDRDVKKNIDRIGTIFATGDRELPMYEYEYKDEFADGQRHVGPMAQDVERLDPKAVKKIGGVKHIDVRKMMGGILRAA